MGELAVDRWWERKRSQGVWLCGEFEYRAAVKDALVASVDGGSIQILEAYRQRAVEAIRGMDSAGLRGYPSELFHAVNHWVQGGILLRHSLSDEGSLEDSDGEPDTHNDAASSP